MNHAKRDLELFLFAPHCLPSSHPIPPSSSVTPPCSMSSFTASMSCSFPHAWQLYNQYPSIAPWISKSLNQSFHSDVLISNPLHSGHSQRNWAFPAIPSVFLSVLPCPNHTSQQFLLPFCKPSLLPMLLYICHKVPRHLPSPFHLLLYLSCALSIALNDWFQVFKVIHLHYLSSSDLHSYTCLPVICTYVFCCATANSHVSSFHSIPPPLWVVFHLIPTLITRDGQ